MDITPRSGFRVPKIVDIALGLGLRVSNITDITWLRVSNVMDITPVMENQCMDE